MAKLPRFIKVSPIISKESGYTVDLIIVKNFYYYLFWVKTFLSIIFIEIKNRNKVNA